VVQLLNKRMRVRGSRGGLQRQRAEGCQRQHALEEEVGKVLHVDDAEEKLAGSISMRMREGEKKGVGGRFRLHTRMATLVLPDKNRRQVK
jgi:hypothetical protein